MGDVIEFRPAAFSGRSRKGSSEAAGDCRILLFTGVRYERHQDSDREDPPGQPTGTKPPVRPKRRKKQA